MDTTEHTQLGNRLYFSDWMEIKGNKYLKLERNVLRVQLQYFEKTSLKQQSYFLTAGEIVALSGDFFGGKEVGKFSFPTHYEFKQTKTWAGGKSTDLGRFLIEKEILEEEKETLLQSYHRLANVSVSLKDIETIYKITAGITPSFPTLNALLQQLLYALCVKNYGDLLKRNLAHFTPWSVRVYVLGHTMALEYAKIAYELLKLVQCPQHISTNKTVLSICKEQFSLSDLEDLAWRYQALALGIELFTFHYYSDCFAAGHGAFIGDLRVLLPLHFGFIGSILVSCLHDELNRVSIYTKAVYDNSLKAQKRPPVKAFGDGALNHEDNALAKEACLKGMSRSLNDIRCVLQGRDLPTQTEYGGLKSILDVDKNYRQPQPMFLIGKDNQIYWRSSLKNIKILSPLDLRKTYESPLENGYKPLDNYFWALLVFAKVRLLSFIYKSQILPLSAEEELRIAHEEQLLNPGRALVAFKPSINPHGFYSQEKPLSESEHLLSVAHGM